LEDLKFIIERITQAELAEKLGIKRANITNWKLMKRVPKDRIEELKKIRKELKNVPKRSVSI
jgi:transcriptional regulator with XRE-family HTH domain